MDNQQGNSITTTNNWQLISLEKQLEKIRNEQRTLMQETMKKLFFLQNLESTIEAKVNASSNIANPNSAAEPTIDISRETLNKYIEKIDDQNLNEGIIIEKTDSSTDSVTLIATDASKGESGSRPIATIACAFNTASPYNIAACLLYTSPSPRDKRQSRMPSSA